ncbi:MAG: dihydroorotate dehydrogenase electron transfer subunit [Desulfurococcaceae archaeon]
MKLLECKVRENKKVAENYYTLSMNSCNLGYIEPGQFVMVKVNGVETLLRRPFAVYNYEEGGVLEILYKVVGKGTRLMTTLREGDHVSVLGPLGRGFPTMCEGRAVLLSRGVGIASLTYLGRKLRDLGCDVITIASFKSKKEDLASDNEIVRSFSSRLIVLYDEDGSSEVSNVKRLLYEANPSVVYTSGSKRLIRLLKEMPFKAYASVEERMGCGLGACLACAVKTINGYKLACKEGPVFDVKILEV